MTATNELTKHRARNPLKTATDWFRENSHTVDRAFGLATKISRSYWSDKPEDQMTDRQRGDAAHDILGACATMHTVIDVLLEHELRRPLLMQENWKLFREHVPAGAYLPVGQLDGDCKKCGGPWPCAPILAVMGPNTDVFGRQDVTEQLNRVQEVSDRA